MRRRSIVLAAVAFGLVVPSPGVAGFSDAICPRAVPKVVAFGEAGQSNDPAKIAAAAKDAAAAYRQCASDAQSTVNVAVEPTVNYDKTRAAQFLVVAGRAETVLKDAKSATADLADARKLATDVAEWQPQSQTFHMSSGLAGNSSDRNSDRNGSRYKDAAKEIVTAADQALANLGVSPAPAASPAAAASPKP